MSARRLVQAVAAWLLPERDREFILGDLDEMHAKWSRDGGRAIAALRYLGALLASARAARASRLARPADDGGDDRGRRQRTGSSGSAGPFASLGQDVRFGLRSLRRDPLFTAAAVACLSLGIGASTAIFSVVQGVLLRALPYAAPEELVFVREFNIERGAPSPGDPGGVVSYRNAAAWRESAGSLEDIAVAGFGNYLVLGGEVPLQVEGAPVSSNYFSLLGTPAARGRVFTSDEADAVVVLSDQLWRRGFGSAPDVVGRMIRIDGNAFEVIGVMPADFNLPYTREQLWVPFDETAWGRRVQTQMREAPLLRVIGRLAPGATVGNAEAELSTIAQQPRGDSVANPGRGIQVVPLHESRVGRVRSTLLMLFGAVGLLLLIACVNVANLLLARTAVRQQEVAIRAALGAGRWRLARQLFTESTLLSLGSGAVGSLLALWAVRTIKATSPGDIPRLNEVGLNPTVLGFAFLTSLVVGWAFGIAPALQAGRSPFGGAPLRRSSMVRGAPRARLRAVLVVTEVAVALVLMLAAGLLINSFHYLWTFEPGFDASGVLTIDIPLEDGKYPRGVQKNAFYQELYERLHGLPEVAAVGGVSSLPGQSPDLYVSFDPPEHLGSVDHYHLAYRAVSGEYFEALRIPLVAGRLFRTDDVDVAVVNEALADELWPGTSAIGAQIPLETRALRVIGVVGDQRAGGTSPEPEPEMYLPHRTSFGNPSLVVVVRTDGPGLLAATVREQVAALDRDQPVASIRTMEEFLEATMARPLFYAALFSLFGGLALVLSALGIFGVASYSVTQRAHEVGVRIVLGAERRHVLGLILGRGALLTAAGVLLGLAAARALTRYLESLLYGVAPNDPATFLAVPLVLVAAALLAFWLPARRAARVDPMIALRGD